MPTYTFDGYTYNETIDGADDYVYKVIDGREDELTDWEIDCADYHSGHVEDKLAEHAEALAEEMYDAAADIAYKIYTGQFPLTDFEEKALEIHRSLIAELVEEFIEGTMSRNDPVDYGEIELEDIDDDDEITLE